MNEQSFFSKIELRAKETEGGKREIVGLIPFNSDSAELGFFTRWIEQISPTAFDKTLADKANVRALWSHDVGKVLGSVESKTLTLEKSESGLSCRCVLGESSFARDAYDVISRGDVSTMSFGFIVRSDEWVYGTGDAPDRRYLKDVDVKEISFGVPFPAFSETNAVAKRSGNVSDFQKLAEILETRGFSEKETAELREIVEKKCKITDNKSSPQEKGGEIEMRQRLQLRAREILKVK